MAKKRELVITIGPDGEVQIQVVGISGKGCLDFTKFLEDELGDVTERVHTTEYFQEEEEDLKIQVGD